MQYDTRVAVVVRADLQDWQKLNCVSFLAGGLAGNNPEIVGAPYSDGSGNLYGPLIRQPVFVYQADGDTLARALNRARSRNITASIFTNALFSTSNDVDNRAAVADVSEDELDLVGIALYADRKSVDKVVKGLKLHP